MIVAAPKHEPQTIGGDTDLTIVAVLCQSLDFIVQVNTVNCTATFVTCCKIEDFTVR